MDKYSKLLNLTSFNDNIKAIIVLDTQYKADTIKMRINRNKCFAVATKSSKLMNIPMVEVDKIVKDTDNQIYECMIEKAVLETVDAIQTYFKKRRNEELLDDEVFINNLTNHELNASAVTSNDDKYINVEEENEAPDNDGKDNGKYIGKNDNDATTSKNNT